MKKLRKSEVCGIREQCTGALFTAEKSKHVAGGKEKKKEGKKRKRGSANADSNGYIESELKDLNVGCGISIFFWNEINF